MGHVSPPAHVLLILAAFSRHGDALEWARQKAIGEFGPLALASSPFRFAETDYYQSTMGSDLQKTFFAFERLVDPGCLAEIKLQTNAWEDAYAKMASHAEPRPLNLDPGYLTLAKLVLASTKDHAHRIYLNQGIFAEVTLTYRHRRWQPHEWTFPDYQREDYQQFFSECRQWFKDRSAAD
jgi:hypothetical protein